MDPPCNQKQIPTQPLPNPMSNYNNTGGKDIGDRAPSDYAAICINVRFPKTQNGSQRQTAKTAKKVMKINDQILRNSGRKVYSKKKLPSTSIIWNLT